MTTTLSPKKRETVSSPYAEGKTADRMGLSAININEAEQEYVLYATATGLRREDFFVSVDRKIVTIIAGSKEPHLKKNAPKNPDEHVRTFTLPDDADPLLTAATYCDGSLEIHIPKGQNKEEKPFMIHVY